MSIVDIIGGGVKGKPHSTKEGRKSAAKRKVKRWHKKAAELHRVANQGMRKLEKKKDYVTDPDATFGGKRIQIKDGPELKPAKRKTWREIAGGGKNAPQEPLSKNIRLKGLGHKSFGKKRKSRGEEQMKKFQLGKRYNIGGRANLLEEMGRIDARKHPDAADRSEKRRVIGELNKGYKSGGRTGLSHGGSAGAAKRGHGAEIK